jgi:hypothetical protein
MQQKTPKRKLHRRQVVAYYRDSPTGDDGASIEIQKEIVARWAAENNHEVIEEVVEKVVERVAEPVTVAAAFVRDAVVQQHATKQGDTLYVIRMEVALWRRWRRGEMSLFFRNLSKHPGDRVAFVTTDKDIADHLPLRICLGSFECCCSHGHRVRNGLAWARAKRMENQAGNGGQPQT